jgi:hypothetical protein
VLPSVQELKRLFTLLKSKMAPVSLLAAAAPAAPPLPDRSSSWPCAHIDARCPTTASQFLRRASPMAACGAACADAEPLARRWRMLRSR